MMKRWKMMVATAIIGLGWLAWMGDVAPQAATVVSPAAAMTALRAEAAHLPTSARQDACRQEHSANQVPSPPPMMQPALQQHAPLATSSLAGDAVCVRRPLTWPKLLSPPTVERLRVERQRQPQATPPSYLRYAALWAQCMESVDSDSTRAYDVFAHAEACVERAPAPRPEIQALCLRHAQQMAYDFSELTPRYHRLRAHADRQVLALVDAPAR